MMLENNYEAKIAVVIPAYKVQNHIFNVINGIPNYIDFIVVVNDASPDDTLKILNTINDDRLYIISHDKNQGVGGAVISGYKEALKLGADVIVKVDGDDQMDCSFIPGLIEPIIYGEADYTKGNRFLDSTELQKMPFKRRVGNLALSFIVKAYSGYWNIFDPTNGFTAIHSSLVPYISESSIDKRFFFETNILLELNLLDAKVNDVAIPARYLKENSSLSEIGSVFSFPPKIFKGLIKRLEVQYFIRDFGMFSMMFISGAILVLFGGAWGIYHWIRSYELNQITPNGTIMISILSLILGFQLLLQAMLIDVGNIPKDSIWFKKRRLSLFALNLKAKNTNISGINNLGPVEEAAPDHGM